MADNNQDTPTILGPDANFKGELSFEKGMRLHGRFEGKITTPGRVIIAKEAKMQADVDAGSILVEGDVRGNLSVTDRVEMKNSARYEGDLRASKLVMEEGAVFSGHVTVGPEATKSGGPKNQNQGGNRLENRISGQNAPANGNGQPAAAGK